MQSLLARLAPEQAGALWIGTIVLFVLFGDLRRPLSRKNLTLLALLSLAPFLYDLLDVGPTTRAWSFRAVFLLTAGMAVWGVRLSRGSFGEWLPNLPVPALKTIAAGMVLMTSATVLTQPADDAGIYTSLGAQRWRETGQLPYSDEKLKGPESPAFGAAATYGPVLYLLHLPAQQLLGPPDNPPEADPMDRSYVRPPMLATQLTTWVMFLIGLGAFFLIARRLATEQAAWACRTSSASGAASSSSVGSGMPHTSFP